MNKTVNTNIGGLLFHIDEDAYQKLSQYFDAIKHSLTDSLGKDEVMKDIEIRVAELLMERQKSDKHVVNFKDVDEVIGIMGQPEDYRIEDETTTATETFTHPRRRKLYRDQENGTIAGVCTGLGHYFGIDPVIVKVFFLLLFFGFGTGILAYIILWIAMPNAVTTSEKLEMMGEPVTISNIEKKVKAEFENVARKVKNTDYGKMGNQMKSGAEKAANGLGGLLNNFFNVLIKCLGAIILVFSSLTLIGLLIGMFSVGLTSFVKIPHLQYLQAFNYTDIPAWILSLSIFLAIGIPFFFFLLLGLKLLIDNFKSIGAIARYSLIGIWIFAVGGLIYIGIKQATEKAYDGKTVLKEALPLNPKDTLHIQFVTNDYFSKDVYNFKELEISQDSLKNEVIYSNDISFEFKKTDSSTPYIQIEKTAEGKSFHEANARAEKINYGYKFIGNELLLDNYLLTDIRNKYRSQEVTVYLYLPKGTLFKADPNVDLFNDSESDFFDYEIHSGDIFQVGDHQIKCLNCSADEENDEINADNNVKSVSIKINGDEIIKAEAKKSVKKTPKE